MPVGFNQNVLHFLLALFFTGFALQVQAEPVLPWAHGKIIWQPVHSAFDGTIDYELKGSSPHADFLLYPNRYLKEHGAGSRENIEAYSDSRLLWERSLLRRHSALTIKSAGLLVDPNKKCDSRQSFRDEKIKALSLKAQYSGQETRVTFLLPTLNQDNCNVLRISFSFSPQNSGGNFGMSSPFEMHFAGPIFPIPQDALYDTKITFSGKSLTCAQCRFDETGNTLQFSTFPSPLHFFEVPPKIESILEGKQKFVLVNADEELSISIAHLISDAQNRVPMPALTGLTWIVPNQLVQNLVAREQNEIQLGRGFYKINPLFQAYHDAAFVRSLLSTLLIQKFIHESSPTEALEIKQIVSISRWLAEISMRRRFESIDVLKNLSARLSFIPFFDGILNGKALVNNAVYLGNEEAETATDSIPFDVLFPTFAGGEISRRADWCLGSDEKSRVVNAIVDAKGRISKSYREILSYLSGAQASQRCGALWLRYFNGQTQLENIELKVKSKSPLQSRVILKRENVPQSSTRLFANPQDDVPFDKLNILVGNENRYETTPVLESDEGRQTREVVVKHSASTLYAKVDGPTTDGNEAQHLYPRRSKFLLTGIQVRYDSRTGNLEGQQGVQWRIEGDPLSRSFSLLLVKDKDIVFVEPTLTGRVYLGGVTGFNDELSAAPASIPFGLGLRAQLSRPQGLWLTASTGFSKMSSSLLAPEGFDLTLLLRKGLILTGNASSHSYRFDSIFRFAKPVATLTTLSNSVTLGSSTDMLDLSDEFVPGADAGVAQSQLYGANRFELEAVAAHDLKMDFFRTVVLEHVVVYGAHQFAIDLNGLGTSRGKQDAVQSLQAGIRFLGTFLGSKGQVLSLSLSRGLTSNPHNVFSLSIGR